MAKIVKNTQMETIVRKMEIITEPNGCSANGKVFKDGLMTKEGRLWFAPSVDAKNLELPKVCFERVVLVNIMFVILLNENNGKERKTQDVFQTCP